MGKFRKHREKTKKNRLQKRISVILVMLAVSLVIPVLSGCSTGMEKQIEKEADLIAQSGKNAVFVADYDISDFNETYFAERRGIPTYVSRSLNIEKTKDLNSLLNKIPTKTSNSVTHYFIGVDPVKINQNAKDAEVFYSYLTALASGADLDILYPVYAADYWDKLSGSRLEQYKNDYKTVTENILSTGSVNVYFPGYEIWLMGNPGCFTEDNRNAVSDDASKVIIMSAFCDGEYAVFSGDDIDLCFQALEDNLRILDDNLALIKKKSEEEEVLFLGDSIFGIYGPPTSIPAVVHSLMEVNVANCGIGGLSIHADVNTPGIDGLLDVVLQEEEYEVQDKITDRIISENAGSFAYGSTLFQKEEEDAFTVLLEFGINDYVHGVKADEFEREYNAAIDRIESEPRHAQIVLVVPGFLNMPDMNNGEIPFQADGESMETYREIIRKIANTRNLRCFDMTKSNYITQENCYYFLEADGIHYGCRGRFITGMELCEFLEGEN